MSGTTKKYSEREKQHQLAQELIEGVIFGAGPVVRERQQRNLAQSSDRKVEVEIEVEGPPGEDCDQTEPEEKEQRPGRGPTQKLAQGRGMMLSPEAREGPAEEHAEARHGEVGGVEETRRNKDLQDLDGGSEQQPADD